MTCVSIRVQVCKVYRSLGSTVGQIYIRTVRHLYSWIFLANYSINQMFHLCLSTVESNEDKVVIQATRNGTVKLWVGISKVRSMILHPLRY